MPLRRVVWSGFGSFSVIGAIDRCVPVTHDGSEITTERKDRRVLKIMGLDQPDTFFLEIRCVEPACLADL